MQRLVPIGLYFAVAMFITSSLMMALRPFLLPEPEAAPLSAIHIDSIDNMTLMQAAPVGSLQGGLVRPLLIPEGPVEWSVLILVWIATLTYTMRRAGVLHKPAEGRTFEALAAPPTNTGEAIAMPIAFLAGALWPWVIRTNPLIGFLLTVVMLVAMLSAAMTRLGARRTGPSTSLGILAGWATVVTCAAFAYVIEKNLGSPQLLAASVALAICAFTALKVQLHMGSACAYSGAVILGLLGLAMAAMGSNALIALATVLALTVVGLALVRVAS